jgi:hypothetical protein
MAKLLPVVVEQPRKKGYAGNPKSNTMTSFVSSVKNSSPTTGRHSLVAPSSITLSHIREMILGSAAAMEKETVLLPPLIPLWSGEPWEAISFAMLSNCGGAGLGARSGGGFGSRVPPRQIR